jgi:6-phosphogluconolactonase
VIRDAKLNEMRSIRILESPDQVASYAAAFLRAQLSAHTRESRYRIALSGGSTPSRMYSSFVRQANAGALARGTAEFFFSDERAVGPDSEQSNFRTARIGLFQPLAIDDAYIHRMCGEAHDLTSEAARYEGLIRSRIPASGAEIPRFDLVFLGMGADGHTASLFPDFDFERPERSLTVAPYVSSQEAWRLTFTLRLINAAHRVLFLVTGREKREAVTNLLSGGIKHDILPAGRVKADQTLWLLDRAAAGELNTSEIDGTILEC